MKTTNLSGLLLPRLKYLVCLLIAGLAVLLIAMMPSAQPAGDPELKVLRTGLGEGTVTSDALHPGINCGGGGACNAGYANTETVELTATPAPGGLSTFAGWAGDCSGMGACSVPMTSAKSVRARFDLVTPITTISDFTPAGPTGTAGIRQYLNDHPEVDTAAEFVAALPREFRQNWILMSRSESLQTGIARSPRILLFSADARYVFTVGMTPHSSYPGSHPKAIEYMQWDPVEKNFRFHEIILGEIPEVTATLSDMTTIVTVPRRSRVDITSLSIDDAKCPKCHSTRNVPNLLNRDVVPATRGTVPGTDQIGTGRFKSKNKPNWDTYDSWGGATPFNRDRIYQGSVEAAAFRTLLNPWTWSAEPEVRAIIEQLELQPPDQFLPDGVTVDLARSVPRRDVITRVNGGPNDSHIIFPFDISPPVLVEPSPSPDPVPTASATPNYSFDRERSTDAGSPVIRGGPFVTLHHSATASSEEGRAVQFFDLLGGADGNLNQLRIADELASHRYATGSVPLDARPIALAIAKGCYSRDGAANNVTPGLDRGVGFFTARHGGNGINEVFNDTRARTGTMPRRKADIQKFNLDRRDDIYLDRLAEDEIGLIQLYGDRTAPSTNTAVERIRQEVFRRPIDMGGPDTSEIQGDAVDREDYSFNTERVALFRYFLEPLGVSVDKWSMGVRGRSRTYSFADVFGPPLGRYMPTIIPELETSLNTAGDRFPGLDGAPPFSCTDLRTAVNASFISLDTMGGGDVPKYTDVQRIFNKSCIECHGGLGYPPFTRNYDVTYLDLSENEDPALGDRLSRSHTRILNMSFTQARAVDSRIYQLIIRDLENCEPLFPFGMMPCGGPKLNFADIKTIERWIDGFRLYSHGDPHLQTVDGTHYDFQSAGEFVLLRGENFELQARQTAIETEAPLGLNAHTELSSCVSVNTAAALRVGPHRITYQPNLSGEPDPSGLQLRVDGQLANVGTGIQLSSGGRILPTPDPGGLQIEYPGGTDIVITPNWWAPRQLWYINFDLRHARASDGVMGTIAPGNWLPALPDGTFLGRKPPEPRQRYLDLYERFADAWRVTGATSLFDYAPGSSTSSFTVDEWPGEQPRPCQLPRGQGTGKPPQKQLTLDVAKQHCARLVTDDRRTNCELDVMVTGEPSFAEAYLRSEKIQLNKLPEVPQLLFPEDDKVELPTTISFDWKRTTDSNGDGLTYRHCVWPAGQMQTFNQCIELPKQMGMFGGFSGLGRCVWLVVVLIICLIIVIVLFVKKRRVLWIVLAIIIVIAIVLVLYFCRTQNMSRTVSLQPGKAYFWKVIVEDGKGGTTESQTWRFAVK